MILKKLNVDFLYSYCSFSLFFFHFLNFWQKIQVGLTLKQRNSFRWEEISSNSFKFDVTHSKWAESQILICFWLENNGRKRQYLKPSCSYLRTSLDGFSLNCWMVAAHCIFWDLVCGQPTVLYSQTTQMKKKVIY